MTTGSIWGRFAALTERPTRRLAEVITKHADHTVTIIDPSGARWRITGSAEPGTVIWTDGQQLIDSAPNLTLVPEQEI